jgi:hypothetical protein
MISDWGIILEIIGFVVLLLIGGRMVFGQVAVEYIAETKFDSIRRKIIPDKYVNKSMPIGIGLVIAGLILQLSPFLE